MYAIMSLGSTEHCDTKEHIMQALSYDHTYRRQSVLQTVLSKSCDRPVAMKPLAVQQLLT